MQALLPRLAFQVLAEKLVAQIVRVTKARHAGQMAVPHGLGLCSPRWLDFRKCY